MCFPVNFVKTKFWWPLVAACGRKKWEVFITFKLQSYNSVGISKRRSNFKNLYLCCFCCVANIMRWLFVEIYFGVCLLCRRSWIYVRPQIGFMILMLLPWNLLVESCRANFCQYIYQCIFVEISLLQSCRSDCPL